MSSPPHYRLGETKSQCMSDCKGEYVSLLSRQLRSAFPQFVANLQDQSPVQREQGRAAVLEYSASECSETHIFQDSTELQSYLTPDHLPQQGTPKRRLFVLEDLPRNFIEVIGCHLSVPPSFFAAHWYDPATPTFNYRSPFTRFCNDRFIIRYPTSHHISLCEKPAEHHNIYAWNSNVNRYLYMYDPKSPLVDDPKSYHALSFWATGARDDGSWDAVLLVDPPLADTIKSTKTSKIVRIKPQSSDTESSGMGSLYPDIHELYPNVHTSTWATPSPSYVSMFEDILSLSNLLTHDVTNDPKQSATIARQLVISIFLAFLRRRYLNLLGLQSRFSYSQAINRCDYLRSFMDGSLSTWQHELFGFIVNVKFRLNVLLKEIEDNMTALGLSPDVISGTAAIPSWERDGWTAVHDSCTTVLNMTNMLLESYLQFVTVEEAQSSNRVAKSLARITVLTTLFIPLSTVAAILSMNETFLPGSRFDWVFWVVSLPILLVIAVVYGKKSFPVVPGGVGGKKRYILPFFRDKSSGV